MMRGKSVPIVFNPARWVVLSSRRKYRRRIVVFLRGPSKKGVFRNYAFWWSFLGCYFSVNLPALSFLVFSSKSIAYLGYLSLPTCLLPVFLSLFLLVSGFRQFISACFRFLLVFSLLHILLPGFSIICQF